jgi:hypothetical protein
MTGWFFCEWAERARPVGVGKWFLWKLYYRQILLFDWCDREGVCCLFEACGSLAVQGTRRTCPACFWVAYFECKLVPVLQLLYRPWNCFVFSQYSKVNPQRGGTWSDRGKKDAPNRSEYSLTCSGTLLHYLVAVTVLMLIRRKGVTKTRQGMTVSKLHTIAQKMPELRACEGGIPQHNLLTES